MDEKTIRRATLITLRRAICERFPPSLRAHGVAAVGCGLGEILLRRYRAHEAELVPLDVTQQLYPRMAAMLIYGPNWGWEARISKRAHGNRDNVWIIVLCVPHR
jgi:hypothetical protein